MGFLCLDGHLYHPDTKPPYFDAVARFRGVLYFAGGVAVPGVFPLVLELYFLPLPGWFKIRCKAFKHPLKGDLMG